MSLKNKTIKLEVIRIDQGHLQPRSIYYLNCKYQEFIFGHLTGPDFTRTPQAIFCEMRTILDKQHPDQKLQPLDINICAVADYIGLMRGKWPDPYEQPLEIRKDPVFPDSGIIIQVPQSDSEYVTVNTNEQRIIYDSAKRGVSAGQTRCNLILYHKLEGLISTPLERSTILRLRYYINGRSREHPPAEIHHWAKVTRPYASGEKCTVCPESPLLQTPQSVLAMSMGTAAPPRSSRTLPRQGDLMDGRPKRFRYRYMVEDADKADPGFQRGGIRNTKSMIHPYRKRRSPLSSMERV